jgi:glycerophosphoryl diester phosphodiesterase
VSYLEPPRPRVFGHRGAAALAPENTLVSFAVASRLGASYLELDVHGTADGTIVVLHDDTVDRTTDGSGPVREMPWRGVERLDAGHGFRFAADVAAFPYRGQGVRIPTLESVLREFRGHRFNIEIKQAEPAIVDEVAATLRREGVASHTLLAAESAAIMADIRRAVGDETVTGSSVGDVLAFFAALDGETLGAYEHPGVALQIPTRVGDRVLVDRRSIDAAHARGVEIHVWTINQADEIERLLDLGVDGIMSDSPGLVRAAAERRRRS